MPSLCLCFEAHKSYMLRKYAFMDFIVGDKQYIYHDLTNAHIQKNADRFWLPMNQHLRLMMQKSKGNFRVSFYLSGMLIDLLEKYRPDVLDAFQKLVWSNGAEFLAGTYYHSAAFHHSPTDLIRQTRQHIAKIRRLFDQEAMVFAYPELAYEDGLSKALQAAFSDMSLLVQIPEAYMNQRGYNQVYAPHHGPKPSLLLKNPLFSQRFEALFETASKYKVADFVADFRKETKRDEVVVVHTSYETLYAQMGKRGGSMDIIDELVAKMLDYPDVYFLTPSMVVARYKPQTSLPAISAPLSTDTAEVGKLKDEIAQKLYEMESLVLGSGKQELIQQWSVLQCLDYQSRLEGKDGLMYFSVYAHLIAALRLALR